MIFRTVIFRIVISNVVLILLVAACSEPLNAADGEPKVKGRALLVGCTKYDHLAARFQLQGGANDVILMRDLLRDRFRFPADQIVTLSENSGGPDSRPTRANIIREIERLIKVAEPGDQIILYLAGHGSQQRDFDPSPDDPEPDGRDEIFLPADTKGWDGNIGSVPNAIVDDELHRWLTELERRRTAVTVIVDACHSGTMTRSVNETPRFIPPGELVPDEVFQKFASRPKHEETRSTNEPTRGLRPVEQVVDAPSVVALYAAQSSEQTVERLMPSDGPDRKPHGLLTYTLCQILSRTTEPMTHRELARRIQTHYAGMGRSTPTPMIDGRDQDRQLFGLEIWPGQGAIRLSKSSRGWTINMGRLHGVTSGSVLKIVREEGNSNSKDAEFVRVLVARIADAEVTPSDETGKSVQRELKDNARCQLIYRRIDAAPLSVAVVPDSASAPNNEQLTAVATALKSFSRNESGFVSINLVESPRDAEWLVSVGAGGASVTSSTRWPAMNRDLDEKRHGISRTDEPLVRIGPQPIDQSVSEWLQSTFVRVAQTAQLKKTVAEESSLAGASSSNRCRVDVELLRNNEPVNFGDHPVLHDDDNVTIRVSNPNSYAIDVTLLFIDGDCEVAALFPGNGEINRLQPDESRKITTRVVCKRRSLEHLIAFAVKSDGGLIDFTSLASPPASRLRTRGSSDKKFDHDLNALLNGTASPADAVRAPKKPNSVSIGMKLLTWETRP